MIKGASHQHDSLTLDTESKFTILLVIIGPVAALTPRRPHPWPAAHAPHTSSHAPHYPPRLHGSPASRVLMFLLSDTVGICTPSCPFTRPHALKRHHALTRPHASSHPTPPHVPKPPHITTTPHITNPLHITTSPYLISNRSISITFYNI